jgi:mono/diheme cytochrome c family protein
VRVSLLRAVRLFIVATALGCLTACDGGTSQDAGGEPGAPSGSAERGAYLVTAAGCLSCHTDTENDGPAFAGGHRLESPYGVFVTPNITPDGATGIGAWREATFVRALREGIGPDGDHYYPSFPYASYAGITEADARDMYAWLMSLEPVERVNEPHELAWYVPGRWAMSLWARLFSPWDYATGPAAGEADEQWQRGAYLVRHLGHCGECHTPRNVFGALQTTAELSGSPKDSTGRSAPDISADPAADIAGWSDDELEFFLEIGLQPDGDFVGGSMTAVVDEHTGKLTQQDRQAIVRYLRSAGASNPGDSLLISK